MAKKLLIPDQPNFGDITQYNFPYDYPPSSSPPEYRESTGLPKRYDKFQRKDLYTNAVGDPLNEAILSQNLKSEQSIPQITIDRVYIENIVSHDLENIAINGYLFSKAKFNPRGLSYGSLVSAVQSGGDIANSTIFSFTQSNIGASKDLGNLQNVEGITLLSNLGHGSTQQPILSEQASALGYDISNLAVRDNPQNGTLNTNYIDETTYNPIYLMFWMRGDSDRFYGRDERKKRIQVFEINNLDLFYNDENNNLVGNIFKFSNLSPIHTVTGGEADGDDDIGNYDHSAAWKVRDLDLTFATRNGIANDPTVSEDYADYIPRITPRVPFRAGLEDDLILLNLSPSNELDITAVGHHNLGDGVSSGTLPEFPDYFPRTDVKLYDIETNDFLQSSPDLQSYYEDDEMSSMVASAPATIAIEVNAMNIMNDILEDPPLSGRLGLQFASTTDSLYYFVIDWNDKDNKIKTFDDWLINRPRNFIELLNEKEKNLYTLRRGFGFQTLSFTQNPNTGLSILPSYFSQTFDYDDDGLRDLLDNMPPNENDLTLNEFDYFSSHPDTVNKLIEVMRQSVEDNNGSFINQVDDAIPATIDTLTTEVGFYYDGLIAWDSQSNQWVRTLRLNQEGYGQYTMDNRRLELLLVKFDVDAEREYSELYPKLTHTYNTPGIKTIKLISFSVDSYNVNFPDTVGRWKLITTRIFLDIPANQYPDFNELGGDDYVTIPFRETTPVIGGIDKKSKYKISVNNTLSGGQIGDNDFIDERFLIDDLENDELGKSINKMDLEQCRYFNSSYSIYDLLNINAVNDVGLISFDDYDGDIDKFPEESSVGQIFITDNQDINLKYNCKLELNAGEISGKSIYDSSGNSNKGLLIGDYKVKKTRKGEQMRRDSFIKVPKKKNNKNGAL